MSANSRAKHQKRKLSLGYSPCPNDTFIFEALVHGRIDCGEIGFAGETLADVETLNRWALEQRLDITKISFHALGHVLHNYSLLPVGCALGRGCGPLLVAARPLAREAIGHCRIGIPGRLTTAAMLLRMFAPECDRLVVMPFETIMPRVAAGEIDAGVIIHESRFTYPGHGLVLLKDLGAWWEEETGLPIPLGGIVAKKSLGEKIQARVAGAIRQSLEQAWQAPEAAMPYVKQQARELDDRVISAHIDLYVSRHTLDLGEDGKQAVEEFLRRGRATGILPPG